VCCVCKNAPTVARVLRRPETPVLLHLPHGHGHLELPREDATLVRDLQVHNRSISLLPEEHPTVAELPAPQPLLQRLLHQDPPAAGSAGEGRLLGAAPRRLRHVRERQSAAPPEAVQAAEERQRVSRQRIGGAGQHQSLLLRTAGERRVQRATPQTARAVARLQNRPRHLHKAQEVLHHRESHLPRQTPRGAECPDHDASTSLDHGVVLRPGGGAGHDAALLRKLYPPVQGPHRTVAVGSALDLIVFVD
jgi:hypothetical protein